MAPVRAADAALAAVAAATLAVSGVALTGWSPVGGRTGASSGDAVAARSAAPAMTAAGTNSGSAAGSPTAGATSSPVPTSTTATSTTATSSASTTGAPTASPTAAADTSALPRLAADKPVTIAIIGDSTSDELGEWPNVLAAELGASRTASIQRIRPDLSGYNSPVRYGTKGLPVQVWNASAPRAGAKITAAQVKKVIPGRPDVVLLSAGHDADPRTLAATLTGTVKAVRAVHPDATFAVVLQPTNKDSAATTDTVLAWAKDQHLPTLDVRTWFAKAATTGPLQRRDGSPTDLGSQVWASTVYYLLAGSKAPTPVGPVPRRAG